MSSSDTKQVQSFRLRSKRKAASNALQRTIVSVALVAYVTGAAAGVWFDARHNVDSFQRRDPDILLNTRVDERYTTLAWWSKAVAGYRLIVAMTVLLASLDVEPSPWLMRFSALILLTGVVLEALTLAYLLVERYALQPNTCFFPSNTAHGRDWCHRCNADGDNFPQKCSNVGPMTIRPPRGISPHWRARTVASGLCLALGVVMLLGTGLAISNSVPVSPKRLLRDARWATGAHVFCLCALAACLVFLWGWGAASFKFLRVATGEDSGTLAPKVLDQRYGLFWWALVSTAAIFLTLGTGIWFVVLKFTRTYEQVHLVTVVLAVIVLGLLVALCGVSFAGCNMPMWVNNPCHESRFCCVHADALSAVSNRCRGFTQGCPRDGEFYVQGQGQLHADRAFQIVFITAGFGLFFALHLLWTAVSMLGARSRLRDMARQMKAKTQ